MALLGAVALGSSIATAGGEALSGVRIDQLQPASPESPFFRAEGPHNPAAEGVEFAAGLTFEYGKGVLKENVYDVDGSHSTTTLVSSAVLGRLGASITPIHWLAFDVSLPFALSESGSTTAQPVGGFQPPAGTGPGVGDLRMGAHFRVIDKESFGLLLGARVWAPFGSQATYLSDHTARAEIDLGVAGDVGRALYGCTASLAPGFFVGRAGDRIAASCAGHLKLGAVVSLGVEPAVEVVTYPRVELAAGAASSKALGVLVEPLVAARFRFGGFRLGAAAGPGFGGGMGSAEVRALVNLAYVGLGKPPKPVAPPPSDRDVDGIPDDLDACPDEAGPPNSNPQLNGCPTHDRDGDGIRDDVDACPDQPGIPYPDAKGNGCPDSDNDGLPDPVDQCVNEPGPPPTGCPKHARLATGGFKIDPAIDFGGGDKLTAVGRTSLEEVAATLRANPKILQVSIAIGTKGAKAPLNDKRAQEILTILRGGNLDSARYEVVLQSDLRAGLVQVLVRAK